MVYLIIGGYVNDDVVVVPKRESILNQDIRNQIHELLNREYRLARPSRILLDLDRDGDLSHGRSVRVVDQNVPRMRMSSEGPPQSHVRDLSWRTIPISGNSPRLVVDHGTQTTNNSPRGPATSSLSETETLSFVKMNERERIDNLNELLRPDPHYHIRSRSPNDPCLEYQLYFRLVVFLVPVNSSRKLLGLNYHQEKNFAVLTLSFSKSQKPNLNFNSIKYWENLRYFLSV